MNSMLKVLGAITLFGFVWLAALPGRSAAGDPPAKFKFLIGEWEFTEPGYDYRIKIEWDKTNNLFKGTLSKNIPPAENWGFELNEHVWSGVPMSNPDALVDVQKWRYGANGVSTKVEWKVGLVDLDNTTETLLVKAAGKYRKVK